MKRLRIFTWHIHGSYLYYLAQIPHDIYLPAREERDLGYFGLTRSYPWPANLHEIPAEEVRHTPFDCIIYQHTENYLTHRHEVLSPEQLRLPQIYLEHDPPQEHPTDTRHPAADNPSLLVVHVTDFNSLMWDCGRTPTTVIDHGVLMRDTVQYTGEIPRGIVVVNNIKSRGRRLGLDIFLEARKHVPLDLVGMGWNEVGGQGEITHAELFRHVSRYRFFFNPIRYTSLGLAVCEAMMAGVPIIGLATTEMVTAVRNGENGYVETNPERLIAHMKRLLADKDEALSLSRGAQRIARERFAIQRFVADWCQVLHAVTNRPAPAGYEFESKEDLPCVF